MVCEWVLVDWSIVAHELLLFYKANGLEMRVSRFSVTKFDDTGAMDDFFVVLI